MKVIRLKLLTGKRYADSTNPWFRAVDDGRGFTQDRTKATVYIDVLADAEMKRLRESWMAMHYDIDLEEDTK